MQHPKKRPLVIGSIAVITLALSGAGVWAVVTSYRHAHPNTNSSQQTQQSKQASIQLESPTPNGALRSTSVISGRYTPTPEQALLYNLTTPDSKVVSTGIISPDESGHFSRNIIFINERPVDGTKVTLTVYVQTKKGEVVDSLSLPMTYQE